MKNVLSKEERAEASLYSLDMKNMMQKMNLTDTYMNVSEYVTFNIGFDNYGIKKDKVHEIINIPFIHNASDRIDLINGAINFENSSIPVLDMGDRFNIPVEANKGHNVIIVVALNDKLIGLMAKRVSDVIGIY